MIRPKKPTHTPADEEEIRQPVVDPVIRRGEVRPFNPNNIQISISPERAQSLGLTDSPAQIIKPRNPAQAVADNLAMMDTNRFAVPKNPTASNSNLPVAPVVVNPAQSMPVESLPNLNTQASSPVMENPLQNDENADPMSSHIAINPKPPVVYNPMTELQKTRAAIKGLQNRQYNDKWNFLDTLKGAGLGFLQGYAATGKLGGGLGGLLTGSVAGSIDPNLDERFVTQNKLANLYGIQAQQEKQEEFDTKQKKAEQDAILAKFKTDAQVLQNQSDLFKYGNLTAEQAIKAAQADDIVTPEESKYIADKYNRDVPAYDAADYETIWVNGKPQTRRKKGSTVYERNNTLNDKTLEVPHEVTIGGEDFIGTPPQILAAKVGLGKFDTENQIQAERDRIRREEKEKDDQYRADKDLTDRIEARNNRVRNATAKYTAAQARLNNAKRQLDAVEKDENGKPKYDTSDIDKQIAAAEADLADAEVLKNEPMPKGVIRPKNPNSFVKSATEADVQKYAETKGISFEEAKKQAEADGYTVISAKQSRRVLRPKNPNTSKGGKNNNVGTMDDYRRALSRIRGN